MPCLMPIRVNGVGVAAISAKIWNGDFPLHPSVSEGPALFSSPTYATTFFQAFRLTNVTPVEKCSL